MLKPKQSDKLDQGSARFYDIRKEIEHILIITHTDADDYAAETLKQGLSLMASLTI